MAIGLHTQKSDGFSGDFSCVQVLLLIISVNALKNQNFCISYHDTTTTMPHYHSLLFTLIAIHYFTLLWTVN